MLPFSRSAQHHYSYPLSSLFFSLSIVHFWRHKYVQLAE